VKKKNTSPKAKEDFLKAAENIFAKKGFDGMKVRDVSEAASANLGTLHYYWGSKEALMRELCERRLSPLIEARLSKYNQWDKALDSTLSRQEQLHGLFLCHLSLDAELFQRFYIRVTTEPNVLVRRIVSEIFEGMSDSFLKRVRSVCDHVSDEEFFWLYNGVMGVLLHFQAFTNRTTRLFTGNDEFADLTLGLSQTAMFMARGMAAPQDNMLDEK